jgi:hypothetical protein
MYVDVDTASGHTVVREADDLTSLSVRIGQAADHQAVALALGPLGRVDGGAHAWLDVAELRAAAGRAADPTWLSEFEKMISYAASQGWVNEDGTAVRAHIENASST